MNCVYFGETVSQTDGDAQPGEHLDSLPPSLVASFQPSKVGDYNGKRKRKSKVGRTLDSEIIQLQCVLLREQ